MTSVSSASAGASASGQVCRNVRRSDHVTDPAGTEGRVGTVKPQSADISEYHSLIVFIVATTERTQNGASGAASALPRALNAT